MRIERTGRVAPLTPRLVAYMCGALGGRSVDDMQSPEERRIDYVCLNGLLAIEIKSLEEDASERLDNLTEELGKQSDWPTFLGSAPMESFIRNMDDPDGVRRKVLNRVGRAIINHLKKADRQLKAHVSAFPRKNVVRTMLLVNEDHEVYDPNTVGYILWHALRRKDGSDWLYPNVDCVVYMSERHAQIIEGNVAFPILEIEGQSFEAAPWKRAAIDRFVAGWPAWNASPLHTHERLSGFASIAHIPETMPRHEFWRLQYRRNPYMKQMSNEQIRDRFDESAVISMFAFTKSPLLLLSPDAITANTERFTHIMVELADRAMSMQQSKPSLERQLAAARRLNLSDHAVQWLKATLGRTDE